MRSLPLLIFGIPGILQPLVGQAATGAIHGRVVQLTTGEPAAGALVRIRQPRLGVERIAITDALGCFRMQLLLPATYTLEVDQSPYRSLPRQVTVITDRPTQVRVWVQREAAPPNV